MKICARSIMALSAIALSMLFTACGIDFEGSDNGARRPCFVAALSLAGIHGQVTEPLWTLCPHLLEEWEG